MEGDGGAPGVEGHLWKLLEWTEVSSTENDLDPNADDVKVEKPILNHAVKSTVLLVLNSCSQTRLPSALSGARSMVLIDAKTKVKVQFCVLNAQSCSLGMH